LTHLGHFREDIFAGQTMTIHATVSSSDVKSSRTSWPRGQNFVLGGLGLEELSSASASAASICPRHVL